MGSPRKPLPSGIMEPDEQKRCRTEIANLRQADFDRMDQGIDLLELAKNAHRLFEKQSPGEKARLLNYVLSNSVWKHGELHAEFKQPFDMLAKQLPSPHASRRRKQVESGVLKNGSPGRTRTSDPAVNSRLLYQLSYRGSIARARQNRAYSSANWLCLDPVCRHTGLAFAVMHAHVKCGPCASFSQASRLRQPAHHRRYREMRLRKRDRQERRTRRGCGYTTSESANAGLRLPASRITRGSPSALPSLAPGSSVSCRSWDSG